MKEIEIVFDEIELEIEFDIEFVFDEIEFVVEIVFENEGESIIVWDKEMLSEFENDKVDEKVEKERVID